jgi:hypothetical protein
MNEAITIARTPRTPQAPCRTGLVPPTCGNVPSRLAACYFEVAEALICIWGPDRIGVRLSPMGKMNDIHDDQPGPTGASGEPRHLLPRARASHRHAAADSRARQPGIAPPRSLSQEEALT